jgi:hypothetical protein
MTTRYRLKVPISAILDKPGGEQISVTLPAGTMLRPTSQPSTTLLGMVGVYWEERHYSILLRDLLHKTERVEGA